MKKKVPPGARVRSDRAGEGVLGGTSSSTISLPHLQRHRIKPPVVTWKVDRWLGVTFLEVRRGR
jgi:hypothetical protein